MAPAAHRRKWTYAKHGPTRRAVVTEIRELIRRMAGENPSWGYTRIQGALTNLGIASAVQRLHGSCEPPACARAGTSDLVADVPATHWGEIAAADFFTTEVWTWHGLVTFYTVFVIDLASRRVQILGSTPHPDETFMSQIVRNLTFGDADQCRVLISDRDAKWSRAVRARMQDAGIRVVQTPYRAPNANAYAERSVRSTKRSA